MLTDEQLLRAYSEGHSKGILMTTTQKFAVTALATLAGALFGKDTAGLVGGEIIFFRIAPTVLSPTGRDYSLTGIPPDVAVLATTGNDTDNALARALEIARLER